jgi:ParB family chromosome partitioning protein
MAGKKRGLGRGLDALLGSGEQETAPITEVTQLPVEKIQRGRFQPRREFDPTALQELADSIKAQGVVQPIVVRPVDDGMHEIIAGERRWRAAQLAEQSEVPVVIRDVDDRAAMAMGVIENIQRENLNAVEEAGALHRLLNEFGLTHQQVAEAVGKSRSAVSNSMRLLDLNEDVIALLNARELEMGHGRALLALKGESQSSTARQVAKKKLSVRATEALVKRLLASEEAEKVEPKAATQMKSDPDVERLVTKLSEKLGAQVKLQQARHGKGKLVISYNSLDELDGILDHIR